MKKLTIVCILVLSLIVGCVQQPTKSQPQQTVEEPITEEPEQLCTEMWICQDEGTRAYRKSDCSFEQITNCEAGCENGECKVKKVIEEPKLEPKEEPKKETKESCAIGWKCLDEKRRGYQSTVCLFTQVEQCKYGCKDGECIETAPQEKEEEQTFSLTEGKVTFGMPGWRYSDFSKKEIFQKEINDYDFKIKLYASASGYDYFRAVSYRSDLWIIEKGIDEATRNDCVEKILKANAYADLRTKQTLCIQTKENNIALVGGYWEGLPKENTELSWEYYS